MAEPTAQSFGDISLGGRGGVSSGTLRITPNGFSWRKKQGGKAVDVKKDEVESLYWMRLIRGCQLSVRRKEGSSVNFLGFREKDLDALRVYTDSMGLPALQEQQLSTSGRNWGSVMLNGTSLMFLVDGKVAFEVPLEDVCSAQQVKDDVMLEFNVDDTSGEALEDSLQEMAFHLPLTNTDYPPSGDAPPSKVLLDALLPHVDQEAASADEAVCSFSEVGVIAPRGRFSISMFLSYLTLEGQAQDYKVRYQSIQRIFILPKTNQQTLVVITLDPPIRKGQTYYAHLLCQFSADDELTMTLDITEEQLSQKNEKVGGRLTKEVSGSIYDVFARVLRGLSGARITRTGAFKNQEDGASVRCSYKADDGHLYPLDKAFFYIHKPPLCIPYEDVESVEFARQGGYSGNVKTFDLVVRTTPNVEYQFRNIQRTEWQNLLDFFAAKKLRIDNLASAQRGPGATPAALALADDEDDPGMRRAGMDDDEDEDEDFDAGAGGESSGSDEDEDESDDAEMVEEDGVSLAVFDKKKKAKDGASVSPPAPKVKRSALDDEDGAKPPAPAAKKPKSAPAPKKEAKKEVKKEASEAGPAGKEKKPRKKKDPNAPKNALSAYMYYSNANRDAVKKEMPDIKFGEIGKVLGERWKALSADAKAPYEVKAKADKLRYQQQMATYKAGATVSSPTAGDASEAEGDEEVDE